MNGTMLTSFKVTIRGIIDISLANLPRSSYVPVTFIVIGIVPVREGQVLVMEAIAKTYRYLDESEMSAQKKPAVTKGAKK